MLFFIAFSTLSKKDTKKRTRQTPPKMQKKGTIFQFAQLCSRIAFQIFWGGLRMRNFAENAIKGGFSIFPGKMAKYICVGAPPPHFARFGGAPGFRQKRVFENRQIFAETTENVVRNGRGSKTHFCTVGLEIGHLRSGSNIVPIYFCFDWHFLSHSPRRGLGELFYFSCFSLFSAQVPFYIFIVAFSSATTSAICPFCCVSFLLFLLVVSVKNFLLVSLLLILLRHSFLSLDFYLLVFLSCSFSSFLRSMFFLPVVCLILFLFFLFLCFFL